MSEKPGNLELIRRNIVRIIAEEHDDIVEVELPNGGLIRIYVSSPDVFYIPENGTTRYLAEQ